MIRWAPSTRGSSAGFTLLEVAIASAVLAVALFAILTLCSTNLRTARALGRVHVDASSLAAILSAETKPLELGSSSDSFGEMHPGYSWTRQISEWPPDSAEPTGLLLVEIEVTGGGDQRPDQSRMQFLLYRPNSIHRASK